MRTAKLLLALTLFIILIVSITTLFSEEEDDLFDCISDPYCPIFDEPISKAKRINI